MTVKACSKIKHELILHAIKIVKFARTTGFQCKKSKILFPTIKIDGKNFLKKMINQINENFY